MLTLSKTTKLTKTLVKWGVITVLAILIITTAVRTFTSLRERFAPPPPPQVGFGKLPPVEFPKGVALQNPTYEIDTLTGTLPNVPSQKEVIKAEPGEPDLLALTKAEEKVAKIGFTQTPSPISQENYKWSTQEDSLSKEITMDIYTGNFTLTSNFLNDENAISAKFLPSETEAIGIAKGFLSSVSSLPQDLDEGKTQTRLYSITNGTLLPAESISRTQVVVVDFYQKNVADSKIFYPEIDSSLIKVYIASGATNPKVVMADFFHYVPSGISSTYPIKTSAEVFSSLKEGDAYIAVAPENISEIKIKNVELGYYLTRGVDLFMPIFVFEGDSFTAYVSAVRGEWIDK